MKEKLLVFLLLFSISCLSAQKLVEATLLQTTSQIELQVLFTSFGVTADNGIEVYKILYETPDTEGTIDTASGILVLPILDEERAMPLLAYQHGTSSGREDVPSRRVVESFLVYYFAANGYISTAADYLGLGDSKRSIHPYLHAGTEASAGIDLIRVAKSFLDTENITYNNQLFVTGYSQGGHAAMAMHREIETNLSNEFEVTAASHMSGPYNLSSTIVNTSVGDNVYNFPSYPVWIFVAYQSIYGTIYDDLSTIFRPEFIPIIEDFENNIITRSELNDLLVERLTELHGASIANRMFTEAFLEDFQTNPDNPMRVALADNDLYDWTPRVPTQLLYCQADEQVSYTNSIFADSVMNARGASDVNAIDIDSNASHGECVIPAVRNTFNFFSQFLDNTTSVKTVNDQLAFKVQPNPAQHQVVLTLPDANTNGQEVLVQIANIDGRVVQVSQKDRSNGRIAIPINTLENGIYFVRVQSEEGYWIEKLIKQ